jgi:ribonuclease G
VLHFGQTRALTAIDVDSAASHLAAQDRLEEICRAVMDGVRLRRLSGLILLDMPRLQKRPQQRCLDLLRRFAAEDPRHPEILGVGPAGLIEMTVRRQRRPLDQLA